jgi:hypothetical protein
MEKEIIKNLFLCMINKNTTTKLLILFCLFVTVPSTLSAQIKGKNADEKQKSADQKKEDLKQEELEAIELGKKRHEMIQKKETRKRMKKNKKKADRVNSNEKPPFWERFHARFRKKKR